MRASTSAIQAGGSTSFIVAVTMMLYMAAARCPPRSEPANSHDFLPSAIPRNARSAQRPFRGIVREADTPIIEEAGERGPAFEHVIHRLGEIVAARELGALLAHPAFQVGDQWRNELLPDNPALLGTLAIDRAFDLEQGIDASDRFHG